MRPGDAVVIGCACALLVVWTTGCETREQIEENFRDITSHESYERSIRQAGLADNVVAQRWSDAAKLALERPLLVSPPFQEQGVIIPTDPQALGFRVEARRGQRIVVDLDFQGLGDGRVFVDLFRQASDSTATPYHEAATTAGQTSLDYPVPRSGSFLIRVQPELLHGGEYTIDVRVLPTLAFPVEGKGPSAILSRWGASREGGRRSHRGVDIFASRGTPALAAAAGVISRVDTTAIGGRVVWLREDGTRHSIYYAHLNRPTVTEGQRVEPGDTVGLVGNTGNARTTPPHLHFAIYRRREGAIDPFAFIEPTETTPARVTAPAELLGRWARASTTATVRLGPGRRDEAVASLEPGTAAWVRGRSGGWYRVRLPDGREGYALASQMSPAVGSLAGIRRAAEVPRLEPRGGAPRSFPTEAWTDRAVVARFGDFGLLLDDEGRAGWVALEDS